MYSASIYYNQEPNSQREKKKNENCFKVDPTYPIHGIWLAWCFHDKCSAEPELSFCLN